MEPSPLVMGLKAQSQLPAQKCRMGPEVSQWGVSALLLPAQTSNYSNHQSLDSPNISTSSPKPSVISMKGKCVYVCTDPNVSCIGMSDVCGVFGLQRNSSVRHQVLGLLVDCSLLNV